MPSSKGSVAAVSTRLCPSSPRARRRLPHRLSSRFICLLRLARRSELQIVADRSARRIHDSTPQFKDCRCLPKHASHSKREQLTPNGDDVPLTIESHYINRKQHSYRVHSLRRNDQQPVSWRKLA